MSEIESSIERFQKSIGAFIKGIPIKLDTNRSASCAEVAKALKRLSEI